MQGEGRHAALKRYSWLCLYVLWLAVNAWCIKPWHGESRLLSCVVIGVALSNPFVLALIAWQGSRAGRFGTAVAANALLVLVFLFGPPVWGLARWGTSSFLHLLTEPSGLEFGLYLAVLQLCFFFGAVRGKRARLVLRSTVAS
jgi:hypothetical protein